MRHGFSEALGNLDSVSAMKSSRKLEVREGPQTSTALFRFAIPYNPIQQSVTQECVAFEQI